VEISKRSYVLTPVGRASALARKARRANLQKARAALEARGYPQTGKRQAASLANLEKALAARRSPEGKIAARLNALRHGVFARLVPESVERLAENPREFEDHRRRFARVFAPQDEMEGKLVRRLADATWRRLRLHYAQAQWEREQLKEIFDDAPSAPRLNREETEARAYALVHLMCDFDRFFREADRLTARLERRLQALLRKRGTLDFKVFARRHDPDLEGVEQSDEIDLVLSRLAGLTDAEKSTLLARAQQEAAGKV
jgi:hypothetical protein